MVLFDDASNRLSLTQKYLEALQEGCLGDRLRDDQSFCAFQPSHKRLDELRYQSLAINRSYSHQPY